jgi:hypothetical protein
MVIALMTFRQSEHKIRRLRAASLMTGRCPMSPEREAFGTKASHKLNKKLTCNVKLAARVARKSSSLAHISRISICSVYMCFEKL